MHRWSILLLSVTTGITKLIGAHDSQGYRLSSMKFNCITACLDIMLFSAIIEVHN